MNRRTIWALAGFTFIAALPACQGKGAAETQAKEAGAGKPVAAVETVRVAPADLKTGLDVVGTLSPKFEAVVKSELRGLVAQVLVTQWVPVKAGQELARMDTRELEASILRARAAVEAARGQEEAAKAQAQTAASQAETVKAQREVARSQETASKASLLEAKVGLDRAEREYQRTIKLKDSGLATQQNLDDAQSARDAASARVEAVKAQINAAASQVAAADTQVATAQSQIDSAKAQAQAAKSQVEAGAQEVRQLEIQFGKAAVRSPINGVVAERMVNVGDMPGDGPMFRVVDNDLLNLVVSVPSRGQAAVKVGQTLEFTTDSVPGEVFVGKVMFINPSANAADRSVSVTVEVPNRDGRLKGGFYAKGRIVTGDAKGILQVPRSALSSWDVGTRAGELYVALNGKAVRRQVKTASVNGDLVEVTSGLTAGDEVVTRGGFTLRDGDPITAAAQGAK